MDYASMMTEEENSRLKDIEKSLKFGVSYPGGFISLRVLNEIGMVFLFDLAKRQRDEIIKLQSILGMRSR